MSIAQSSSWTSFLRSIALFNGDLSTLTAPPFILSPTSLVEYSQYWGEHPDLLVAPTHIEPSSAADKSELEALALQRIIGVTKWFISTLRLQYCLRNESMGSEKKPLNPFLGEVFVGRWGDLSANQSIGETTLLLEQVSHHPPVTAYVIANEQNGVLLQGYNGIKASISTAAINVKQYGHALLEFKGLEELYLITLPPLHIEGLITALPFVELDGTSYIQSSNGYMAQIEFSGRGYFCGKKNSFKARIYRDQLASLTKENALATMAGQWSAKLYIGKGAATPAKTDELFYDATSKKPEGLVVKPIAEQHELESRRAWQKVAAAIKKSDYDLISHEKAIIENHQRELRKREQEQGIEWQPRWFDSVDYADTDRHDAFVNLTNQASLLKHNGPLGSLIASKYDKGSAKHWRYSPEKRQRDTEIVI